MTVQQCIASATLALKGERRAAAIPALEEAIRILKREQLAEDARRARAERRP